MSEGVNRIQKILQQRNQNSCKPILLNLCVQELQSHVSVCLHIGRLSHTSPSTRISRCYLCISCFGPRCPHRSTFIHFVRSCCHLSH
ncbi:hypothetical protein ScPMuIL_014793 [Solemya velum]